MMRTLAARQTVQARAPLTTGVFPLWGGEGLRGGEGKWTEGVMGDIRRLCLLIIVMVSSGESVLRGIHFMNEGRARVNVR